MSAMEIWPDEPNKAAQKDTDARWTLKIGGKVRYRADGTPLPMIALPDFGYGEHRPMPAAWVRPAKTGAGVAAIDEEMARVQQRLAELAEQRKTALAAEADKGRPMLLAALGKVRIAPMSKDEAKTIAKALSDLGPSRVAQILSQR